MQKKKTGRKKGSILSDIHKERISESSKKHWADLKAQGIKRTFKNRRLRQKKQPTPQVQLPTIEIPAKNLTVPLEQPISPQTQPIKVKQPLKQEITFKTQKVLEKPIIKEKNQGGFKIWTLQDKFSKQK